MCKSRNNGGLAIKNLSAWNTAQIAKLVWAVEHKKDTLWVRWVHGKYLKNQDWWEYQPPSDCGWNWRKICKVKEDLKHFLQSSQHYSVSKGYKHLNASDGKVPWARCTWSRMALPRHSFVLWMLRHHRLPTKLRLAKFIPNMPTQCFLCNNQDEDETHLFTSCTYAISLWRNLMQWWPISDRTKQKLSEGKPLRMHKIDSDITVALFAAYVYHVWHARNLQTFKNHNPPLK